jgi:hypothetical protein
MGTSIISRKMSALVAGSDISRAGQFVQDNARARKTVFDDAAHGESNMTKTTEPILRTGNFISTAKSLTK